MKKSTTTLGVLALLGSATSLAMTVSVVPSEGITTACCTATVLIPPANDFFVTLHAADIPGNGTTTGSTGATLTIEYDPAVVTLTGAALSPGSPLDFITAPTVVDSSHVLISALRNAAGYASGTTDTFQVNFTAIAVGDAGIVVIDDGLDNSWTDQDANAILDVVYNQANVTVSQVPVPAAAWLVAPAILAAGRFSRRRKAA